MLTNIPHLKWFLIGIAFTMYIVVEMSPPWGLYAYVIPGLIVSCMFLMYSNPKDGGQRIDLALCVALLAWMWPVILFAMLLQKPWNDPKWKNRNAPPPPGNP